LSTAPPGSDSAVAQDGGLPYHVQLDHDHAQHLRKLGWASLLAAALPLGFGLDGGLYLHEVLIESGWPDRLRLLTPAWFGLGLLGISSLRRLGRVGQGVASLALLAVALGAFSASRLAYGQLFGGFASYVARQPLPALLGLALVSTGAELRWRSGADATARRLLLAGAALLLALYAFPQRGVPFVVGLGESIYRVMDAEVPSSGMKIGLVAGNLLGWLFDLFPAWMAVLALVQRRERASTDTLLGPSARYGLSGLIILACYRMWMLGFGFSGILLQIRTALLIAIVVGVTTRAFEGIARAWLEDSIPQYPPRSVWVRDVLLRTALREWLHAGATGSVFSQPCLRPIHPFVRWLVRRRYEEVLRLVEAPTGSHIALTPEWAERCLEALQQGASSDAEHSGRALEWARRPRFSAALAAGSLVMLFALMFRMSEPTPNLAWTLGPRTGAADTLFSEALPNYIVALSRRNGELRNGKSAGGEAAMLMREQAQEMQALAREVDPVLATRIDTLTRVSEELDLTGHLWSDGAHALNTRIRELGLPYYVEPNVDSLPGAKKSWKLFYVRTYFVESIARYSHDDREYGALRVRRLDSLNVGGTPLGYVRNDEPFAVVAQDEIDDHGRNRAESVFDSESCGVSAMWIGEYGDEADALCAKAVARIWREGKAEISTLEDAATAIVGAVSRNTERHELQHQIDGQDLPIPAELFALVPLASDLQLERAAKELSAYLCELVSEDPLEVVVALSDITDFLLTEEIVQVPERYAAGVIAEKILGVPVIFPMGAVANQSVAALWQRYEEQNTSEATQWISRTADQAHDALFGEPCGRPVARP
jgi:hypothetical protein